ncbi:MAG TPA: putative lipid II flippase FtsW [Dermatophilaceae bacterium]|nr:putative lipid II flippase FtsW [Dermatophilaceae bacterium]
MTTTSKRPSSPAGRSRSTPPSADSSRWRRAVPVWQQLDSPVTIYYLLLSATAMLVVIGLVMVLSASSVTSYKDTNSAFTVFFSQLQFAVAGVISLLLAIRIPLTTWKRLSVPLLAAAIFLQALVFVPGLGVEVNGNRNWIRILGQQVQPSEFAKVALVLFGATVLTKKRRKLGEFMHVLVPLVFPAGGLLLLLVLGGGDLGTGLVLLAIIAGILFAAGVPARMFFVAGAGSAVLVAAMALTSANRMGRIQTWLGGCTDPDKCFQTIHGQYALADGGWWGVGLGASREKWSWLPAAHNDFIFAIIGEELGLPGTLVIIGLFGLLAFACYRLVLRSADFFVRVATAGVMVWILAQAVINMGAVIGLLPVIGVPLPLVSSGGSALVATLFALGMLLSFARNEPGCREALAARPGVVRRSLAVMAMRPGRKP